MCHCRQQFCALSVNLYVLIWNDLHAFPAYELQTLIVCETYFGTSMFWLRCFKQHMYCEWYFILVLLVISCGCQFGNLESLTVWSRWWISCLEAQREYQMIRSQLMQEYSSDILKDNKEAVKPVRLRKDFCSTCNDHDELGYLQVKIRILFNRNNVTGNCSYPMGHIRNRRFPNLLSWHGFHHLLKKVYKLHFALCLDWFDNLKCWSFVKKISFCSTQRVVVTTTATIPECILM